MRRIFGALMAGVVLLAAGSVRAHHSPSSIFDMSKKITLTGTLTQVEWVNPHSWVHVDVTDENGKVTAWSCETAPPNMLYRQGWRRDSLKPGDQVVVEGFLAKDGSHTMSARSVVTPDGKKLFAGSPTDGGPQDQKPAK